MYLEWLGASSEVLGRSLNVPRGVFGGPWRSLGGLPLIVSGGSLGLTGGTGCNGMQRAVDEMRVSDPSRVTRGVPRCPKMSH